MIDNLINTVELKVLFKLYFCDFAEGKAGTIIEISDNIGFPNGFVRNLLSKFRETGILYENGKVERRGERVAYSVDRDKILGKLKRNETFIYAIAILDDIWRDNIHIADTPLEYTYDEYELNEIRRQMKIE